MPRRSAISRSPSATDIPEDRRQDQLSSLLSQALVAFTIELDNEFEHRMPHSTTAHGLTGGPWLVSMVMWWSCMRFVGEDGITASELEKLARTKTNLNGMQRWGYVVVRDKKILATPKGRKAQEVWEPLSGEIERRWEERFGKPRIDRLRAALRSVIGRMNLDLPDCLPILGYGLLSKGPELAGLSTAADDLGLPALLARVLLAFAMEFERESGLSLAICANLIRVLDEDGVAVRELPVLGGVSKEAINTALRFIAKHGLAVVETEAGERGKIARLTSKGLVAQDGYRQLTGAIERRWRNRFGEDIDALRQVLSGFDLFRGIEPYADGWRAAVRKRETLPYYPMVLHRGGYPDGS